MKVFDNGPGISIDMTDMPVYDYFAGIEIRGSSSQMFLKKSYGLETWDAQQNTCRHQLAGHAVRVGLDPERQFHG